MSQIPEMLRQKILSSRSKDPQGAEIYKHIIQIKNDIELRDKTLKAVSNASTDFGCGELTLLCDFYGSDKGSLSKSNNKQPYYPMPPHTYTDVYEALFYKMRNTVKFVFECGIGSNKWHGYSNSYKPGASLRVWRDFFPYAHVFGGDIDRDVLFSEERISTFWIDQTVPESIDAFFKKCDVHQFDIMIDDGLHTYSAAYCLFANSFKYLSVGGWYIIEDLSPEAIALFCREIISRTDIVTKYFIMETPSCAPNSMIAINKLHASGVMK